MGPLADILDSWDSCRRNNWIKRLIYRKLIDGSNNLGLDLFPDPVSHLGLNRRWSFSGVAGKCPKHRKAGIKVLDTFSSDKIPIWACISGVVWQKFKEPTKTAFQWNSTWNLVRFSNFPSQYFLCYTADCAAKHSLLTTGHCNFHRALVRCSVLQCIVLSQSLPSCPLFVLTIDNRVLLQLSMLSLIA